MRVNIKQFSEFYESSLGQMARRILRQKIRKVWPSARDERILGFGYTTPFLRSFRQEAECVVAAMPEELGCMAWPHDGLNSTTLAQGECLPFPDRAFDKILIVHALEFSVVGDRLLRECWRVLSHGGQLLLCVPNRRGIWSRVDDTPFGHGQPFTQRQAAQYLEDNMFTVLQTESALYAPPVQARPILKLMPFVENIGDKWFSSLAGVVLIEARKQLYGGVSTASRADHDHPAILHAA